MRTAMYKLTGLLLIMALAACQPAGIVAQSDAEITTPPAPIETILPAPTSTVLPDCPSSEETGDVTLATEAVSSSRARVNLTGLQPGETLKLILTTGTEFDGAGAEAEPIQQVNAEGRYTYEVGSLRDFSAPEGEPTTWQVRVLHSGGIICGEVLLPAE